MKTQFITKYFKRFHHQISHNREPLLAFQIEDWINFAQMDWTGEREWTVCTLYSFPDIMSLWRLI